MKKFIPAFLMITMLLLAACGSAPEGGSGDATVSSATNDTLMNLPLVNARTGETFTLASFADKVVYVEPMATWCTNCRHQLGRVREVYEQLDASQYVFVGISVETNISAQDLATYVDEQNFQWIFAVASPEMLIALDEQYGSVTLNPPSTPHFIVSPDGTLSQLYTGVHEAADLLPLLQQTAGT